MAVCRRSAGLARCSVAEKWPRNAGNATDAAEEEEAEAEEPEGFMCYGQLYNPKKDKELPTKIKSEDWHKRNAAVRVLDMCQACVTRVSHACEISDHCASKSVLRCCSAPSFWADVHG